MLFEDVINDHYEPREYPALAFLADQWICKRPFEGLKVLVATPIYRNTLVQYQTLIAGGAQLYVGHAVVADGSNTPVMPCDEVVVDFLREEGVPVITDADIKGGAVADDFDLILDCAGQFAFCHPRFGFVELTRSGVQFFEKSQYPVYVADSGIVKRIETILGTGDGCFRGFEELGYRDFENKKLVVFGSGKVGCGIALQGVRRGMQVTTVTDIRRRNTSSDFCHVLERNGVGIVDCLDDLAVNAAVEKSNFLVTATGVKSALSIAVVSAIKNSPELVVANMGVEDEFGEFLPKDRVLNQKAPLNFLLEEPTHLKYIDTSLALHAALGERLLQEFQASSATPFVGPMDPPAELEQRLLMTTIQNGVISSEVCDMMR